MLGVSRQFDGLVESSALVRIVLVNGFDVLVQVFVLTFTYEGILMINTEEYRSMGVECRVIDS